MTTYVLATNAPSVSETLCEHIRGEVGEGDTVHADILLNAEIPMRVVPRE